MAGYISLPADYGRDRENGEMVMPLREKLGLPGSMSLALEDRLCHLAATSRSYKHAAQTAEKFGIPVDAVRLRRLVQCAGKCALQQEERRIAEAFDSRGNKAMARAAGLELREERFSMALMLDGAMLRFRGDAWGLKPASAAGDRVAWRELKAGLVIRLPEPSTRKYPKPSKYYVASDGGLEEAGRKLYAEALRHGLESAQRVYVVADGAAWIWNVAAEHFPGHIGELDFYHASEHLWTLARSLHGEEGDMARKWAEPLLSGLKYRGGGDLLSFLEELTRTGTERLTDGQREVLRRETAYFQKHKDHLNYPGASLLGLPLGSGEMESACFQLQGRFKRPGQFWSQSGEQNLMALEMALRNGDWDRIWGQTA